MGLNKPTQELRRYLKDNALLVKWPGVDLVQTALQCNSHGATKWKCAGQNLLEGQSALLG